MNVIHATVYAFQFFNISSNKAQLIYQYLNLLIIFIFNYKPGTGDVGLSGPLTSSSSSLESGKNISSQSRFFDLHAVACSVVLLVQTLSKVPPFVALLIVLAKFKLFFDGGANSV